MRAEIEVSLQAEKPFAFQIGQAVDHVSGGMLSIVIDRSLSANGLEIYTLRHDLRERHMLGSGLVAA